MANVEKPPLRTVVAGGVKLVGTTGSPLLGLPKLPGLLGSKLIVEEVELKKPIELPLLELLLLWLLFGKLEILLKLLLRDEKLLDIELLLLKLLELLKKLTELELRLIDTDELLDWGLIDEKLLKLLEELEETRLLEKLDEIEEKTELEEELELIIELELKKLELLKILDELLELTLKLELLTDEIELLEELSSSPLGIIKPPGALDRIGAS